MRFPQTPAGEFVWPACEMDPPCPSNGRFLGILGEKPPASSSHPWISSSARGGVSLGWYHTGEDAWNRECASCKPGCSQCTFASDIEFVFQRFLWFVFDSGCSSKRSLSFSQPAVVTCCSGMDPFGQLNWVSKSVRESLPRDVVSFGEMHKRVTEGCAACFLLSAGLNCRFPSEALLEVCLKKLRIPTPTLEDLPTGCLSNFGALRIRMGEPSD